MGRSIVPRGARGLLSASLALGVCLAASGSAPVRAATPARPSAVAVPRHCEAASLQAAVACVEPSVLRVVVALSAKEYSEGSSLVVRTDATGTYILTNRHVVEGGTARHTVAVSPDGKHAYAALAVLANSGKPGTAGDLAVIKLAPNLGLRPLAFGDSQALRAGGTVSSIGYGLGLKGEPSVTEGVVSAVHRDIGDGYGPVWIQHQSTINHGNSGGPLITLNGDVVGINTLSVTEIPNGPSGIQGLFFAIPGNAAQRMATTLIAKLEGTRALPPPTPLPAPFHSKGFTVTLPPGWFVSHLATGQPLFVARNQQVQVAAQVLKGPGHPLTAAGLLALLKVVVGRYRSNFTSVRYGTITYTDKKGIKGPGVIADLRTTKGATAYDVLAADAAGAHIYNLFAIVQRGASASEIKQLNTLIDSFTGD